METFLNLPDHSRLWVYASNKTLNPTEVSAIQSALKDFTAQWTSHDMPIQGAASVLFNRLVLIGVDEAVHGVSGCGIDKSVKIMKDLGAQYGIDFFNRLQILVKQNENVEGYSKEQVQEALNNDTLNEDSLVFNPMVQTLGDFKNQGFVPLNKFWMAKQFNFVIKS